MKKYRITNIKRLIWYFIGFILFYAPFALFQKGLAFFISDGVRQDIHDVCFRCGLIGVTGGIKIDVLSVRFIATLLLLGLAFLLGPIYCRFFCVTGAITEYLSRLLPEKLKINWQKFINPTPVKYGILTGFLLTPFLGLSVACSYCSYSLFQRMTLELTTFDIGVLSSTNIITLFVWFMVFGVFTKGGRGFCSYLCPVGAAQSFIHSIGRRFRFTRKLIYTKEKCISCGTCIKLCPMGAIQDATEGIKFNIHNCITCNQCVDICSKCAITYGVTNEPKVEYKSLYNSKGKLESNEAS